MRHLRRISRAAALLIVAAGGLINGLQADEGMWLLNAPPRQRLKEAYSFEPTPAWLEHVQKSSVRFNNGGSGSFVSAEGLIITNHHVAADIIEKISTEQHNLLRDGFHARSRGEELKCEGMELNVLISIENVTDQVNAAVKRGASTVDAFAARRAVRSAIEKESLEKTGLRSDTVTLYQGGEYHLYRYKRYTDVRLVFAPEQQAAFFGGDPDNFEFPRFNLDISFFRAYENGQPAKIEHYLKFQPAGVVDNELVFVCGHPGSTNRLLTLAELEFFRDARVPTSLLFLKSREVALTSWAQRSLENARRAHEDLLSTQNSRKVFDGRIAALLDPAVFTQKRAEEQELQAFAKSRPEFAVDLEAWTRVTEAQQVQAKHYTRRYLLETLSSDAALTSGRVPTTFDSKLASIARVLYRVPTEKIKPSGERLTEYRDSIRASLELNLFSDDPIYEDLEEIKLTNFLTLMAEQLGVNDPAVRTALDGKSPGARATELVRGTQVKDVAFRKKLYAMKAEEMVKVDDPLIAFVRALDADSRAVRRLYDEQSEVKTQAHARIAKVRYAKYGDAVYPDATFTLRLSYGAVKAYEEQGKRVGPFSTLGGVFDRSSAHQGREPFDLPERWLKFKEAVNPAVPYNFVSTCDIIGGNSGSPTINRAGEFVGIIFDGNIYSLVSDFGYSDAQSRAISVDVRAIVETLKGIYGADTLLAELLGKK